MEPYGICLFVSERLYLSQPNSCPKGRQFSLPHAAGGETEAQRGSVVSPGPLSRLGLSSFPASASQRLLLTWPASASSGLTCPCPAPLRGRAQAASPGQGLGLPSCFVSRASAFSSGKDRLSGHCDDWRRQGQDLSGHLTKRKNTEVQ